MSCCQRCGTAEGIEGICPHNLCTEDRMSRESDHLTSLKAAYERALTFPPADPSYRAPSCESHDSDLYRYSPDDDENICLGCLAYEIESLRDYMGDPGPRPPLALVPDDDDDPDVCQRCGERGSLKHGDPRDCRSPSCTEDRYAAMEARAEMDR